MYDHSACLFLSLVRTLLVHVLALLRTELRMYTRPSRAVRLVPSLAVYTVHSHGCARVDHLPMHEMLVFAADLKHA